MAEDSEIYDVELTGLGVTSDKQSAQASITPVQDVAQATGSKHSRDVVDLARWGKKQQLKRNFNLLSTISLTCSMMLTWEGICASFIGQLNNGGPAGLIYGFIFCWFGSTLQTLVMAELASMMPLTGGQYNWVAILAPRRHARFISYLTGWINVMAWQANLVYIAYLGGSTIQGLLILNYPDSYEFQNWHGTLILYGVIAFALFVNTVLIRILPHVESCIFIVHVVGFIVIVIPLLYFSDHRSAEYVFTTFNNGGGWSSMALSWFVGLSPTMPVFFGVDAGTHMAEEIHNASSVIPRSMISAMVINGTLGLAMVIGLLFSIGDLELVLNTPTRYPYIQIFYDAVRSRGGATAMVAIVMSTAFFGAIGGLATASRITFAFSRERALPFSKFISWIEPKTVTPINAIGLSVIISLLLGLINIGSTVAFYALTSLVVAANFTVYNISALVLLYRRLRTDDLKYGPFHLGRWGVPIILVSLVYSTLGIIFSFFPPAVNPDTLTMNWSIAVYSGVIVLSLVFWCFHGRKVYQGPIQEVVLREVNT